MTLKKVNEENMHADVKIMACIPLDMTFYTDMCLGLFLWLF